MNRFSENDKEHGEKTYFAISTLMGNSKNKLIGILLPLLVGFVLASLILGFQLISIGIILALFLAACIFFNPKYFILFWLIFAAVSDRIPITGYGITSYGVLNLLFLPLLAPKVFLSSRQEFLRYPARTFYLLFLLLVFLSIWYSPQSYLMAIRKYFNFIIPFLISLLMVETLRYEKELERFLKVTLISVATIGILGTVMYYLNHWVIFLEGIPRATGLLYWPNDYALFLNINLAVPLSLAFLLKKRSTRIFYAILALIILVSIIPTLSKAGYVGALMILLGVPFMLIFKKRNLKFLAIAGLLFFAIFAGVSLSEYSQHLSLRLSDQQTFVARTSIWKGVMHKFLEHPIMGNGFLSSTDIVKSLRLKTENPSYTGSDTVTETHNLYVMLLLETGIIGTLSFILFYFSLLIYAFRIFLKSTDRFTIGVSLGFVVLSATIFVISFSEQSFFTPAINLYFWFFLSFLICFHRREQMRSGTAAAG